jgi:hypothetical protein
MSSSSLLLLLYHVLACSVEQERLFIFYIFYIFFRGKQGLITECLSLRPEARPTVASLLSDEAHSYLLKAASGTSGPQRTPAIGFFPRYLCLPPSLLSPGHLVVGRPVVEACS